MIYIAGPFFNETEREYLQEMISEVRKKYYEESLWIPMEHIIPDGENMLNYIWGDKVYRMDINALKKSSFVVALYLGHYSDTGTAFEIGYARALNIPVFLYIPKKLQKKVMSIMPLSSCTPFNYSLADIEQK